MEDVYVVEECFISPDCKKSYCLDPAIWDKIIIVIMMMIIIVIFIYLFIYLKFGFRINLTSAV